MQYVTPDKIVNSQCPRFILTKMYNSRGDQGYVVMIKSLLETDLKVIRNTGLSNRCIQCPSLGTSYQPFTRIQSPLVYQRDNLGKPTTCEFLGMSEIHLIRMARWPSGLRLHTCNVIVNDETKGR